MDLKLDKCSKGIVAKLAQRKASYARGNLENGIFKMLLHHQLMGL